MAAEAEEETRALLPPPPPQLLAAFPEENSDPTTDPPDQRAAEAAEEEQEEEARPREAKRRRTCPVALEKLAAPEEAFGSEGRCGFSFSFDTRGIPPIETTPKFGSFNYCPAAEKREEDVEGIKEEGEGQSGASAAEGEEEEGGERVGSSGSDLGLASTTVEGKSGI